MKLYMLCHVKQPTMTPQLGECFVRQILTQCMPVLSWWTRMGVSELLLTIANSVKSILMQCGKLENMWLCGSSELVEFTGERKMYQCPTSRMLWIYHLQRSVTTELRMQLQQRRLHGGVQAWRWLSTDQSSYDGVHLTPLSILTCVCSMSCLHPICFPHVDHTVDVWQRFQICGDTTCLRVVASSTFQPPEEIFWLHLSVPTSFCVPTPTCLIPVSVLSCSFEQSWFRRTCSHMLSACQTSVQ